jgi:hypothetical protein
VALSLLGGALEAGDSLVEVLALDAQLLAYFLGRRDIAQIVLAKYLNGHFLIALSDEEGLAVADNVFVWAVAYISNIGAGGHGHELGLLVVAVVDEHAGFGRLAGKNLELLAVDFLGRKHVDVVPADARNHPNMVLVEVKLRPPIHRRR